MSGPAFVITVVLIFTLMEYCQHQSERTPMVFIHQVLIHYFVLGIPEVMMLTARTSFMMMMNGEISSLIGAHQDYIKILRGGGGDAGKLFRSAREPCDLSRSNGNGLS